MKITKTKNPKQKPAKETLGFGKYFTDHVFKVYYTQQEGWHNPEITPYEPIPMDPAASVLHYGQALFEGMKAFEQENGTKVLFRPEFNWHRMTEGAERLCMQAPPKDLFLEGIQKLVEIDQDWIPKGQGYSLYIRPTLIGTEGFLGVRPSEKYLFYVILSPVGSYYGEGLKPLKIWVEEDYLRAAPGGLGATKAAANYAGSLKAAYEAKKNGYSQVLWLDTKKEAIEEVGTMNIFFVMDNVVLTPSLDGTILGGGVRDSILTLLKEWKKPVIERKVLIREVQDAYHKGQLKEIFGTGTAAVISPVGELASKKWKMTINNNEMGPLATQLYEEISAIQYGIKPDNFNWLKKL
jgi:branched-chain amino acid aminotransferase